MNRQYQSELDKVRLSETGKQALVDRLREQTAQKNAKRYGWKRPVLIAAVCAVLAATAGAAVLHDTLRGLWTDASQPVYQAYQLELGRTQTADGWTVTLTDCVGSENMLYIGVEVTVPAGVDPEAPYRFGDYDMAFPDGSRAAIGGGINDAPPYDGADGNTLHFVWDMNVAPEAGGENLQGKTVDLTLDSIHQLVWNTGEEHYDEVVMTDHVWKFEDVKLDYPTAETTYQVGQPVAYLGGTATLDEITVSPFGVKVNLSGGSALHHHAEERTKDGDCLMCALTVYDADGQVLYDNPQWGDAGSWCDEDAGAVVVYHNYRTADWNRILIDPAKVAKVKVNTVEIPLK